MHKVKTEEFGMMDSQERERLVAELAKLPSQRAAVQAEAQLSSELAGLEREVHFKSAELRGMVPPAI